MAGKNIFSFLVALLAFLFIVRLFNISLPITVTQSSKTNELSVTGEGSVEVVPDTTFVDVGIYVSDATSVESAQKSINDTNKKIVDAMTKLGIKKENIKTSNYSIYPNYSEDQKVKSYSGNVTVTIKSKDISLASRIVEESTKAGANQVQGVRFTVDDPGRFREEARNQAIADAKDQANKLAKSLNLRLGKVVNISETSPDAGIIRPLMKTQDLAVGAGGAQFEPGSETITSVVTLYFEKK